jgi:proton-dependent oligopeptide transporter, POT family
MEAVRNSAQKDLFGHPQGLSFLFATEMWERFSYYGMRALLTLYLVKHLLLPGHAENVIGLAALKGGMEWVFGPLEAQPFASQIYGGYTGLVYLTPILGGFLADRVFGQRRMVIIGALLMALGHFLMAFESMLLFALLMLILGNGAFKPNISTQVGELYAEGDARRDRAFSIFYMGINLGAMLGSELCGLLGENVAWHYGFSAAGVGLLFGMAIYAYGGRELPPDKPRKSISAPQSRDPLTGSEWRVVAALLLLFLPNTLFWAAYEQQGNTIALWIDGYTDRTINLWFWRFEIPASNFQSVNPAMILAFTPFIVAWWGWLARRSREPSAVTKMAAGCFMLALSYLVLAATAIDVSESAKASWGWLIIYFAILTTGELYLSPVGLSLVSKVAPARMLSLMMGVWLATSFLGNFMAGWLGAYWSSMGKPAFFCMIAAVPALAGLAIAIMRRPLAKALQH